MTDHNPLETDSQFQLTAANPNPSFRARKDGDHYYVEFELQKEEWDYFVDPNINRQGMVLEMTAYIAHRNQPAVEKPAEPEKPKGGQLARLAGIWCREPLFWKFLGVSNEQDAIEAIYSKCGVTSRAELDSQVSAAKRFHEIIRIPYKELQGEYMESNNNG